MQSFGEGALPELRFAVNDIGICYNDLGAEFAKLRRLDGLDIGIDHRHDGGCLDDPVAGFKATDPSADVLVGYFEYWGHDGV